jgi:hypothetical protein
MIQLGSGKTLFGREEPEYNFITSDVPGGTRVEAWCARSQDRVPFTMALDLLAMRDLEFLTAFLQALRSSDYKAYFFETPPMTFLTVSPLIPKRQNKFKFVFI